MLIPQEYLETHPVTHSNYTAITELPSSLLTLDQIRRFAHRYGYAHTLAQSKRVLEVACGAGSGLSYLAQNAVQMVGLDYTAEVLHQAQQHSHVPLVQGDAQQLPFAENYFDLILCFEAIYYLQEYRRFLAECHRLLRPSGTALICQSNPDWPDFVPGAMTTHYPSLPELTQNLKQAGFREIKAFGLLPVTATTPRQRVVNMLRRWVLQSGILPWLGPLKDLLQRLGYGQMLPLPAAIDNQWVAMWQESLHATPLDPTQVDRTHRVIYVEARV